MENARSPQPPVDTSSWLTCAQSSDMLGVSENTIRTWVRTKKLHPRRGSRVHPSGAIRELDVFDPQELANLGRRRMVSVPNDPGDLAARAFELFDTGTPQRRIVVALRVLPAKVEELHDQWANMGGADLVIGAAAHAELERFVGPFVDVADLVARVRDRLGAPIEVAPIEGPIGGTLARATDDRAVIGDLDHAGPPVAAANSAE